MRKLLVTLDDELDIWLKSQINQTETVREALRIYKGNIKEPTLNGIRQAFNQSQKNTSIINDLIMEINDLIIEIDSKIDYIASKLDD